MHVTPHSAAVLHVHVNNTTQRFKMLLSVENLNSDLHTCMMNILPTKSSSRPHNSLLIPSPLLCLMTSLQLPCCNPVGSLKHQLFFFKVGSGDQTQVLILAKPALYWLKYFPPQLFNTLYLNNPNKPQIDFASLIIEFKIPTIYLNMYMETNTTTPSE